MIAQFRRVKTSDDDLRQVQDAVGFVFQDILGRQIVDGRLITGVNVINGQIQLNHLLGRKYLGYIVVSKNANVDIWDSPSSFPASILVLNGNGAATISLWVF